MFILLFVTFTQSIWVPILPSLSQSHHFKVLHHCIIKLLATRGPRIWMMVFFGMTSFLILVLKVVPLISSGEKVGWEIFLGLVLAYFLVGRPSFDAHLGL